MNLHDLERIQWARRKLATGEALTLRKTCGLSCTQVGAAAGVAAPTVASWERGQRTPRADAALRYARVLERLEQSLAKAS